MNNFCVYFLINRGNSALHARMIFLATEKSMKAEKLYISLARPGVASSCYCLSFSRLIHIAAC